VVLSSGEMITLEELPDNLLEKNEEEIDLNKIVPLNLALPEALERLEKKLVIRALKYSDNVQSRAAEILGISRRMMNYKMKKYEITN
jgi:two-component system NtrC family response regulator